MLGWIMRRWLWLTVLLVGMVGAYALAGFWLLPKIVRAQAIAYVDDELGKRLSLGEIRFNPFSFRLEVGDIAIADPPAGSRPLVALKRLTTDFQISSLWKGAYTFRDVTLEAPYAQAIIRPDGSLNLAELVPESEDDSPLPEVLIQRLAVARGRVDFADRSRRMQPAKRLSPIEFELRDFRTTTAGGVFRLHAAGDQGEVFDWQGKLSLRPFASDGNLKVAGLQARTVHEFLSEELPLELTGGSFDIAGRYRFAARANAGTQLDATLSQATARQLGLRGKGLDRDWITLPVAALDNTRFSLAKRHIAIDALRIDGMKATVWREADGSLNLPRLLKLAAGAPAPASGAGKWQFDLGRVVMEAAEVDFEDKAVRPSARFRLQPLSLTASGLSLDLERPVPVTVTTTINGKAKLSLQGEVVPASSAATLQLDVEGMPLREVLAYLPNYPKLELRSGDASAKGELKLSPSDRAGLVLSFSGDASVDRFKLLEREGQRELLAWERVDAEGVRYSEAPDVASIQRIRARKPYATVTIAPDRTINLATLFTESGPSAPAAGAAMAVKLGELQIAGGTMAFADYSIEPNFSARIDALDGRIRGLSTATDSVADIDLKGQIINKYSPVTIQGGTNVFAFDKHTDIKMVFRNIDLPLFNPYSGRFAGYAISKGKLTTELHYQIDDRQLEAAHHVILDQLEWGEATDSKEKVTLPIRLATSLLKNRDGVIDLDLPVTGSLDDPKFRMWPIVWQILKNILVKIVTAPFAFIGSLFQGAEDAQYVNFAPGSAELSEAARGSLAALAKGLADRPALRLDIPAGVAAEADPNAIAEQRLQQAATGLVKGESPAFASLPVDDQVDLLEKLYRQQRGSKPDIPDAEAAPDEASRKEKRALRDEAALAWLRKELLAQYQPTPVELAELGRARANAIQDALLTSGELDPTRVFITASKVPSLHEGAVRVELALE